MSEVQLKETIAVIRELPATNTASPFDDLVLVSLRQGTNWVTYSYDRRNPPKALKRINEISRSSGWVRNFTVQ
jgi:capsular polysaccharide biosynthesis protein